MMLYISSSGVFESLFVIGAAILWLYALVDALRSDFKDGFTKVLWALAVLFIPFFGWVLYLLIGRKQRLTT
jgi:hypothetical protein